MTEAIRAALSRVAAGMGAPEADFVLERPRESGHGDLATNLAMVLARARKSNPRALANDIVERAWAP